MATKTDVANDSVTMAKAPLDEQLRSLPRMTEEEREASKQIRAEAKPPTAELIRAIREARLLPRNQI